MSDEQDSVLVVVRDELELLDLSVHGADEELSQLELDVDVVVWTDETAGYLDAEEHAEPDVAAGRKASLVLFV